jgi:hypothetical protein
MSEESVGNRETAGPSIWGAAYKRCTDGTAVACEIRGAGGEVKMGRPQNGRTTAMITMMIAANPGTSFSSRKVLPASSGPPAASLLA